MITEQSIKDEMKKILNNTLSIESKLFVGEESELIDNMYNMFSKIYNADIRAAKSASFDEGYIVGSADDPIKINEAYDNGYEAGYSEGNQDGYSRGRHDGYCDARDDI